MLLSRHLNLWSANLAVLMEDFMRRLMQIQKEWKENFIPGLLLKLMKYSAPMLNFSKRFMIFIPRVIGSTLIFYGNLFHSLHFAKSRILLFKR